MKTSNIGLRKEPDLNDRVNFLGNPTRQVLAAQTILHRFGSERGRWWYGPKLLAEITEDFIHAAMDDERVRSPGLNLLNSARYDLAVSHEWNSFDWFCTLKIPAGVSIECWVGPTAPQPEWQAKPDGRILHGGLVQYLVYDLDGFSPSMFKREPVVTLWRRLSAKYAWSAPPWLRSR